MKPLLDSYSGAFEAGLTPVRFSRQALADLGREYFLLGHLIDRVGLPLVMERFGNESYVQFSIEEWMGASPIYSVRMQRALGFEGDEVGTVFKNIQLDIGAPPQFMDFQFRLDRPDYGEFWLAHCGALLDVEPFGEKQVRMMCHEIEDPTFDATAAATHPCMKMRPIHRPPRIPAGRTPHCRWKVFIDEHSTPYEQHANLDLNAASKLASIPIDLPPDDADVDGGWPDYSGPFDAGFQFEDLNHRALVLIGQEAAVQAHLLVRAYLRCIADRFGDEVAVAIGARQWVGSAAVGAHRLKKALDIGGNGVDAIAKVFQMHPHFMPRTYIDWRVSLSATGNVRLSLGDCAALEEGDCYSWFAAVDGGVPPAFDAVAGAVNPFATCRAVAPCGDERFAWEVEIDPASAAQPDPPELALVRISRGAEFPFVRRRPLRM